MMQREVTCIFAIFVCLILPHCIVSSKPALNCSKKIEETCSSRYDMVATIVEAVNSTGCGPKNLWYCMCINSTINIMFYEIPPYIYMMKDGKVDGILPAMLRLAMQVCCYGCIQLKYKTPVKTIAELMQLYTTPGSFDALLPVLADINGKEAFGAPYVKFFPTPGVGYLEINHQSEQIMDNLVKALFEIWPLFVISLLLTFNSGVIIWILDSYKNPEEFPPSFFSGITEGFWWAHVSMTTVGYGDKTPKSWFGRSFAVIWITIGVAISAIFTASLTSSMTSSVLSSATKLRGLKVGVLTYPVLKYEANIVYGEGGTPIEYNNVSSLTRDLGKGKISGILMDMYVLRYHWSEIKKSGLQLLLKNDVENSDTSMGVQFRDKKWGNFVRKFFESNKDADKRILFDAIGNMKEKLPDHKFPTPVTTSPFSSPSVYKKLIRYLGISCACSMALGFLFEVIKRLYYRSKLARNRIAAAMAKTKNGQDLIQSTEEHSDQLDKIRKRIEKSVMAEIKEEFQLLRQEMNNDEKTFKQTMKESTA